MSARKISESLRLAVAYAQAYARTCEWTDASDEPCPSSTSEFQALREYLTACFAAPPAAQDAVDDELAEVRVDGLRAELQKQCVDWGVYWRASDAHGVDLDTEQALELLRRALGVEIEIRPGTPPAAQDRAGADALPALVTRLMHVACESGVAEGRYRAEWLSLVERTRAALAAPAAPLAPSDEQTEAVTQDQNCWLVEEFGINGNSTGRYMLDQGALTITEDVYKARRFGRMRTAMFRAEDMRSKHGGDWRHAQHCFAAPDAALAPTDEQIDALDTFALYVMAPHQRESVRSFARAVLAKFGGAPLAASDEDELARLRAMLAECAQYLKEDETPAQRIERERRDTNAVLTLLVREKQRAEAMEDLLRSAHAIASRSGADTAWQTFAASIQLLGVGSVTARTYRLPCADGAPLAAQQPLTAAARDVLAERRRQVEVEGWTAEHDDRHGPDSLSVAAACYALHDMRSALAVQTVDVRGLWDWTGWSSSWFKPKDRRRNLIRAAALLLAEIERLDRITNDAGVTATTKGES